MTSAPITPIPSEKQLKALINELRDGKSPSAVAIFRGLVHAGALAQGLTPKEALEAASDPELENVPVRFEVTFE